MQTCGAGIMSADDLYSTSGSCSCFGNEDRYRIENSQGRLVSGFLSYYR